MAKRKVTVVKAHKRGQVHVRSYRRRPPYRAVVKAGSKRAKEMPF